MIQQLRMPSQGERCANQRYGIELGNGKENVAYALGRYRSGRVSTLGVVFDHGIHGIDG